MSDVIMDIDQGLKVPGRVINLDQARVQHGGKAGHMVRMLAVGDPLADAVIVEIDALGKEGCGILNASLADGLESLTERPPAITALLQQLETMPAWVESDMLGRGEVATLSVSPFWYALCAIPSALVHTYASPAIARLLTQTGRLTTMAPRRLAETGMWAGQATVPGGLLRGAPGYQATVQVRLLHARMRSNALKHGWDTAEWGVPISQVDVARTWLIGTPHSAVSHPCLRALDRMRACSSRTWTVAWYPGAPRSSPPGTVACPAHMPVSAKRRGAMLVSRPVWVSNLSLAAEAYVA